MKKQTRLHREAETLKAMFWIYCKKEHHQTESLCDSCNDLQKYALYRLEKCPFQEGKTTCANCPIHCYQSEMREQIRTVMRTAGPWMLLYHPILTIFHFWDGRRKQPVK
jgi:hypothetical protein